MAKCLRPNGERFVLHGFFVVLAAIQILGTSAGESLCGRSNFFGANSPNKFGLPNASLKQGRKISLSIISAQFQPDAPLDPQYKPGGYFHIFVKNPAPKPVTIQDILIDGASLRKNLKRGKGKEAGALSIWIDEDPNQPSPDVRTLVEAGEPIWFGVAPNPIPPGTLAEVVLRTRTIPARPTKLTLLADGAGELSVEIEPKEPNLWLSYIGFSPKMDTLYCYVEKKPAEQLTLSRVYLDESDVTTNTKVLGKAFTANLLPLVITLRIPLRYGSYHLIRVVTKEGEQAVNMVKAWDNFFIVGMYGGSSIGATPNERLLNLYENFTLYHINTWVGFMGTPDSIFRVSKRGLEFARIAGIRLFSEGDVEYFQRYCAADPPMAWYLTDEPDVLDFYVDQVKDPFRRLGSLAQDNRQRAEAILSINDKVLSFLQIDATYSPACWYVYGQLADLPAQDPYYYPWTTLSNPNGHPHVVIARGDIVRKAYRPKPVHLTLYVSCEAGPPNRYPSPQEERIMAAYAIGTGAKGISYWMFPANLHGVEGNPELLSEVGRINLEVQTLAPLLSVAHPLQFPINSSNEKLWLRTLLCGEKGVVLVLVNEQYVSQPSGFSSKPLEGIELALQLPDWFKVRGAFVVASDSGVSQLPYTLRGKNRLSFNLDRLDLTSFVVLASEAKLSSLLSERFNQLKQQSAQHSKLLADLKRKEAERLAILDASLREKGVLISSGFEVDEDWLTDWALHQGAYLDDSEKRSGGYSLMLPTTTVQDGQAFAQAKPAVPGKTYRLTLYAKSSKHSERAEVILDFFDKEGKIIAESGMSIAGSTDWGKFERNWTAPEGAVSIRPWLWKRGGDGFVWVDDVSLVEKKEHKE